jgi:hypothetical protein
MAGGTISLSGEFDDVNNEGYVSGAVAVTSIAVEAKVGASRLSGREALTITNKGAKTIYYGPSGVTSATGDPLFKDQFVSLPSGDNIGVFVVTNGADTATVIVQEHA